MLMKSDGKQRRFDQHGHARLDLGDGLIEPGQRGLQLGQFDLLCRPLGLHRCVLLGGLFGHVPGAEVDLAERPARRADCDNKIGAVPCLGPPMPRSILLITATFLT